jgi:hypothetical protein
MERAFPEAYDGAERGTELIDLLPGGTMQGNGRKDAQGTVSKAPDDMDEGELREHIAKLVTENKRLIRANDELYNELQAVKARITKLATG